MFIIASSVIIDYIQTLRQWECCRIEHDCVQNDMFIHNKLCLVIYIITSI